MYRITGITLHNICQYADFHADLRTGITAVTGPNGMGKSTLLRALVYGLTGQVDGLWGTQKDLQKDGTADPGYVDVQFTDGTDAYSVRRFSVAMSAKFPDAVAKNGTIVHQKRRSVDAFMEAVFGIPCQLMFQVCWSRQGELAQLLTAPAAVVSTFLGKVFDTSSLDRLRDKVKSVLDTVASLSSICVDALDRDEKALAALPDAEDMRKSRDAVSSELKQAEEILASLDTVIDTGMPETEKDAMLMSLSQELEELDRLLPDGRVQDDESVPDAATCNIDVSMSTNALLTAERKLSALKSSAEHSVDYVNDVAEKLQRLKDADAELSTKLAQTYYTCPVCGGAMEHNDASMSAMCQFLTGKSIVDYSDGFAAEAAKLAKELAAAESRRDATVKAYDDAQKAIEGLQTALDEEKKVAAARGAIDLSNRARALENRIAEISAVPVIPDDAVLQRNEASALVDQLKAALRNLEEAIADAAINRRVLEKSVADDKAVVKRYETNRDVRNVLTEIRSVFAQDRAQARYLKARIGLLNARFDQQVKLTGLPFRIRLDETSRTFVYTTQDGYEHAAVHLSGAQKSMAAVALQMALLSVMKPNMNLYLVDEPTEALDDENKVIMAGMFERMNRMLPAVSGTMLIATRDQAVIEACGNAIDVGEQR